MRVIKYSRIEILHTRTHTTTPQILLIKKGNYCETIYNEKIWKQLFRSLSKFKAISVQMKYHVLLILSLNAVKSFFFFPKIHDSSTNKLIN